MIRGEKWKYERVLEAINWYSVDLIPWKDRSFFGVGFLIENSTNNVTSDSFSSSSEFPGRTPRVHEARLPSPGPGLGAADQALLAPGPAGQ